MFIYARRNKEGVFVYRDSCGEHNHPFANDARTYSSFRKMEANDIETAVSLLKKHTSSEVLMVRIINSFKLVQK